VPGFLAAIGPDMKVEGKKQLVRLDQGPDVSAFRSARPERAPKGHRGQGKGDTSPVEWNDAPEPRRRKPKPEERSDAKPPKRKQRAEAPDPAVHAPFDSTRRGARGGKPASKAHAKPGAQKAAGDAPRKEDAKPRRDGAKGPPPPKGKPNSKKNRARAAARKAGRSGDAAPKRR